ncbi:MAG: hypothetical protein VX640_01500 [Pseudomonadota bacterium]|nr:hypothetical protein [Pseudomonadota bacterium]
MSEKAMLVISVLKCPPHAEDLEAAVVFPERWKHSRGGPSLKYARRGPFVLGRLIKYCRSSVIDKIATPNHKTVGDALWTEIPQTALMRRNAMGSDYVQQG